MNPKIVPDPLNSLHHILKIEQSVKFERNHGQVKINLLNNEILVEGKLGSTLNCHWGLNSSSLPTAQMIC